MNITLDDAQSTLSVGFENRTVSRFFLDAAREQQSFFLQLDRELKQFQRFTVTFTDEEGLRFSADAEVVQIFPSGEQFGSAFQLCEWDDAKAGELERALSGEQTEESESPQELHESVQSPAFRIREMNPSERFRLSLKAGRTERQILLRDSTPQILLGLLSNARIEETEVKTIVQSNYATAGIMQRVAENKKWMSNPEIAVAIARNPKTPSPLVIKLLPRLRNNDLQIMAKGGARENIRRAALKLYLQRTGQTMKR